MLVFFWAIGFAFGRCFRGMNPWFILFAVFVFGPMVALLAAEENLLYSGAFGVGFVSNFGNIFRLITTPFSEMKMGFQLAKARREERSYQDDIEAEIHRQTRSAEEDLSRQKSDIEDELYRQKREADEHIQRAAEELRRREEALRRQQEEFSRQANNSHSMKDDELFNFFSDRGVSNFKKFEKACEVLEMSPGKSLREYKKKYRSLSSQYHSDKVEGCTEAIKKYAKEKTQLINVAMDIIEKHLKD